MFRQIKDFFTHEDKVIRDNRWIFASMLVGSMISLIAALALSADAVILAKDPGATLTCAINSVISCLPAAKSIYNHLFGFPNSFLGLISEPVVITVAIASLLGVKFPKAFMFTAQIFYTLGFLFAYYLFLIGLLIIHAVCPWCFLVTLSTTFVFFSMTRFNIREGNLYLPERVSDVAKSYIEKDFDKLILASLILVVFASLIIAYGGRLFA